ncbi:hypothetical protein A0H81_00305 [Grifola frondosa]|uniref:Uncharacterized protein n=1 Tax=Grifola frondosa TaxID=5627 RepID=A0A1C7MQ67_GRIFR|nr:hypothetical protein A0H81_00305 [Grifola frondosa]
MSSTGPPGSSGGVESQLGSSADRPIELDLDIDMDIFGDGGGSNSGLNSNAPVPEMFAQHSNSGLNSQQASEPANAVKLKEENDAIDLEILKHLHNHTSNSGDIFAPLGETTSQNPQPHGSAGPPQFHPHESQKQPSPSSILASFGAGSSNSIEPVSTSSGGEAPFDLGNLDLSNFSQLESGFFDEHTASSEMDMIGMDDIFNMEAEATGKEKAS